MQLNVKNIIIMKTKLNLNAVFLKQMDEALAPFLQKPVDELIRPEEACYLLHCSYSTLRRHTKSGRLISYQIGNRILYKKSEVLEAVKPINL